MPNPFDAFETSNEYSPIYGSSKLVPAICQEIWRPKHKMSEWSWSIENFSEICKSENDPRRLTSISFRILEWCQIHFMQLKLDMNTALSMAVASWYLQYVRRYDAPNTRYRNGHDRLKILVKYVNLKMIHIAWPPYLLGFWSDAKSIWCSWN